MKRTPTLEFVYDESIDRGMRITRAAGRPMSIATGHERGARRAAQARTSCCSPRTRTPTATRSARCWRCTGSSSSSARTRVMFMSPDEFPLPWEYRDWTFERLVGAPPDDVAERTIVFLDCGNIDRMPVDFLQARRPAHPQHRPPPRQHPLRHGEPGRTRRPRARPRSSGTWRKELGAEITPRDRRRALRGPRHRHRQVHVREHHAGGPPDGGRADRGRGRAARGLPPPLRGPALPPPPAAPARARRASSATTTARSRSRTSSRTTTRRRARRRPTPRASSTTCAPSRARRVAVLVRELLADDRDGHAQGQPARHRRPRRRVADRPRVRRRRAPAGGRLHDRAAVPELVEKLREHVREQLSC